MSNFMHDLLRTSRLKLLSGLLAAGAVGALAVGGAATVRANPLAGTLAAPLSTTAAASFDDPFVQVQYRERHGWRGYRGDRVIGRHYGDRPIYRDDYYGDHYGYDPGAAVVAGIFGLAAGAIIAGALAPPLHPAAPYRVAPRRVAPYRVAPSYATSDIAYCSRKYRSFDPVSFTYLGYDGRRHYCRIP